MGASIKDRPGELRVHSRQPLPEYRFATIVDAGHIVGPATAARLADDRQRRVTNVGQDEHAVARHGSRPHELWVPALQPAPAGPASIEAALALRDDPLEVQLAGVGEHERALALDRLAEHEAFDSGEAEEVEGDE
jgi:hypothetical protein